MPAGVLKDGDVGSEKGIVEHIFQYMMAMEKGEIISSVTRVIVFPVEKFEIPDHPNSGFVLYAKDRSCLDTRSSG